MYTLDCTATVTSTKIYISVQAYMYIQGVSGGIVNTSGGGGMDYSE
jgi:hypothetical protein